MYKDFKAKESDKERPTSDTDRLDTKPKSAAKLDTVLDTIQHIEKPVNQSKRLDNESSKGRDSTPNETDKRQKGYPKTEDKKDTGISTDRETPRVLDKHAKQYVNSSSRPTDDSLEKESKENTKLQERIKITDSDSESKTNKLKLNSKSKDKSSEKTDEQKPDTPSSTDEPYVDIPLLARALSDAREAKQIESESKNKTTDDRESESVKSLTTGSTTERKTAETSALHVEYKDTDEEPSAILSRALKDAREAKQRESESKRSNISDSKSKESKSDNSLTTASIPKGKETHTADQTLEHGPDTKGRKDETLKDQLALITRVQNESGEEKPRERESKNKTTSDVTSEQTPDKESSENKPYVDQFLLESSREAQQRESKHRTTDDIESENDKSLKTGSTQSGRESKTAETSDLHVEESVGNRAGSPSDMGNLCGIKREYEDEMYPYFKKDTSPKERKEKRPIKRGAEPYTRQSSSSRNRGYREEETYGAAQAQYDDRASQSQYDDVHVRGPINSQSKHSYNSHSTHAFKTPSDVSIYDNQPPDVRPKTTLYKFQDPTGYQDGARGKTEYDPNDVGMETNLQIGKTVGKNFDDEQQEDERWKESQKTQYDDHTKDDLSTAHGAPHSEASTSRGEWDDTRMRKEEKHSPDEAASFRYHQEGGWERYSGIPYRELEDNKNYYFYTNQIPCEPDHKFIDEIHREWWGDYALLEKSHGYIQWLFPIRESGMNYSAQILMPGEIERLTADRKAMNRFRTSYTMMLDFYGMKLMDTATGEICRSENWQDRLHNLNSSFHNYLRITRIIKCLGLLDVTKYQMPLIEFFLREIYEHQTLGNAEESCLNYWIDAVTNATEKMALSQYAVELKEKYPVYRRKYDSNYSRW